MCPIEQVSSTLENMAKLKDKKTVANAFSNFFLTTSEKLNRYKSEKKGCYFVFKRFISWKLSINIIPITEAEIKGTVSSLTPKNSSGYDEITSKIIKSCASLISIPLSYIYNYSLHTAIFPDRLKMAVVKPLYKKGDIFDISNYRPISMLPTFAKILEKAM